MVHLSVSGVECLGFRAQSSGEEKLRQGLNLPDPLRVQVPNNHILTQNLYYNYCYPKPKYQNIGYLDPLGEDIMRGTLA